MGGFRASRDDSLSHGVRCRPDGSTPDLVVSWRRRAARGLFIATAGREGRTINQFLSLGRGESERDGCDAHTPCNFFSVVMVCFLFVHVS